MAEQSRVEPGNLGVGSSPSSSADAPKGAASASVLKTTTAFDAANVTSVASIVGKPAEPKPFEMIKPEAFGATAKLATVSARAREVKAAAPKGEPQQPSSEKRRMTSVAPEAGKPAEQAKTDAKSDSRSDAAKLDVTKVETPRMPAGKVTVAPLGEKAWEIKGLTPPKNPEAAKAAEQGKAEAQGGKKAQARARAPKFSASELAGKLLSFAAFVGRSAASATAAKAAKPKAESSAKPDASAKLDSILKTDTRVESSLKAASGTDMNVKSKRRFTALAAMLALAVIAGAVGGALATSLMMRQGGGDVASATSADPDLQGSVTRIDGDVQALKSSVEQIAKASQGLMADTGERLDRLEQQQAENSARFGRMGESTDRMRTTSQASTAMAAVAPAMPRDTTGSVTQPPAATNSMAAAAPPRAGAKTADVGRLPIVEGWVLRDVGRGGAVIEGKHGFYEVYAGDPVPGLGRVDAIRRQDGRWVVVTTKGLVVSR